MIKLTPFVHPFISECSFPNKQLVLMKSLWLVMVSSVTFRRANDSYFYSICNLSNMCPQFLLNKKMCIFFQPENILLSSEKRETIIKVSDFGLSKFVNSQCIMKTLCGTPLYVAPEVLATKGLGSYTKKVDIWSLGVILFVW